MKETIRVLITDDHAIVRKGLSVLLATERDIMDLVMPRMDGIEATRKITEAHPEVKVLVLTSFAADDKVFPAVKAGALGFTAANPPSSPTSRARCSRSFRTPARRNPPATRSPSARWRSYA